MLYTLQTLVINELYRCTYEEFVQTIDNFRKNLDFNFYIFKIFFRYCTMFLGTENFTKIINYAILVAIYHMLMA